MSRMRRSVHADLLRSYGLPVSITAAARLTGIPYTTLCSRIARGQDLLAPVRAYGQRDRVVPQIAKPKSN